MLLRLTLQSDFIKETLDYVIRESQGIHILETILSAEAHESALLQGGTFVGKGAANELVILHIVSEAQEPLNGYGVVSEADHPMAEIEEESLLRIATFGHQRRIQNLLAELKIRIAFQDLVDIRQKAFRVNDILLEI